VLQEGDLPPDNRAMVEFEGDQVLLLRTAESVFAISNRCPHLGCSLSKGMVNGHSIVCPCHDWRFDLRTGEFLDAPEISLRTYECKIDSGNVQLRSTAAIP